MVSDGHRAVREEMERVIRRLNVLEYLILGAAALMALGGGALTAFLLKESLGASFRTVWFVSSLLLFLVPGVFGLRILRGTSTHLQLVVSCHRHAV